jgi:NAD-dependent SIR2 family protein deacetylase
LADEHLAAMRVPDCPRCGGTLMPDVVFFGGSVPAERVARCRIAIAEADALLAVGTSLQVFSGYRFCRQAAQLGKPVAVLNPGRTRADDLATVKLATDCESPLSGLVARLRFATSSKSAGGGR